MPLTLPPSSFSPFPVRFRHAKSAGSKLQPLRIIPRLSAQSRGDNATKKTGVIVVGAGLAGLAAATRLHSEGISFILLEASDAVGGRVRTDTVDGFLLDRGFQIFITAYPEARKLLDYEALDLQRFYAGARVFYDGGFHTVADPLRHFLDSLSSLTNPVGSLLDKCLIGLTRIRVLGKSNDEIMSSPEVSTINHLKDIGFSDSIVNRFFRPFFGGIFFDRELETSSRLFDFIFKCLALGENTLPSKGIGEIAIQLASKLPADSISLSSRVHSIHFCGGPDPDFRPVTVKLENGDVLSAEIGVVVAVEEHEAAKLLKPVLETVQKKPVRSTVCLYFSAEADCIPVKEPVLFINGSNTGIVNNMFFATNVAPSYGPPGKALVSVSLVGTYEEKSDDELTTEVLDELSSWFGGSTTRSWKHLRTYRIPFAQPNQCPPTDSVKDPRIAPGLYRCGDYMISATFDGALVSGRRAVEALIRDTTRHIR